MIPRAPHPELLLGRIQTDGGIVDAALGRLFPLRVALRDDQVFTHRHIMGVAGMGKSKLLEAIILQQIRQGIPMSFLDPHSDAADAVLSSLIGMGYFNDPAAFDRLLYVEFAAGDRFMPFNVLSQPHLTPDVIADDVLEAMHRAWPELASGAAQFDTLVTNGIEVLLRNGLTLPALFNLILDQNYRQALLARVDNFGLRAYFDNFDKLKESEQANQSLSTIRRINLLTRSPIMEYGLGMVENRLDFRKILDEGTSVIYDLGNVGNANARKLLGCLLTVGYERAALSRRDVRDRIPHHLVIDEFSQFAAQSSGALETILSETRKFGLFVTMSHQTWGQLGERLHGALQNVGVKIALRIGREDAETMAKWFGFVDPLTRKDERAYYSLQEQWEGWVDALVNLDPREALVKIGSEPARKMRTLDVPDFNVPRERVEEIKEIYRRRLMTPQAEAVLPHQQPPDSSPKATRKRVLD